MLELWMYNDSTAEYKAEAIYLNVPAGGSVSLRGHNCAALLWSGTYCISSFHFWLADWLCGLYISRPKIKQNISETSPANPMYGESVWVCVPPTWLEIMTLWNMKGGCDWHQQRIAAFRVQVPPQPGTFVLCQEKQLTDDSLQATWGIDVPQVSNNLDIWITRKRSVASFFTIVSLMPILKFGIMSVDLSATRIDGMSTDHQMVPQ